MKFVVYRDQIYIIKIFALILLPPISGLDNFMKL